MKQYLMFGIAGNDIECFYGVTRDFGTLESSDFATSRQEKFKFPKHLMFGKELDATVFYYRKEWENELSDWDYDRPMYVFVESEWLNETTEKV